MHLPTLALLAFTLTATALPLNINLGAYSPALVVGDGAISFEGAEGQGNGVTQIVNALQGAAVEGATAAAAASTNNNSNAGADEGAGAGAGEGAAAGAGAGVVQAAAVFDADSDGPSGILDDPTAALPTPGSKVLDPRP